MQYLVPQLSHKCTVKDPHRLVSGTVTPATKYEVLSLIRGAILYYLVIKKYVPEEGGLTPLLHT